MHRPFAVEMMRSRSEKEARNGPGIWRRPGRYRMLTRYPSNVIVEATARYGNDDHIAETLNTPSRGLSAIVDESENSYAVSTVFGLANKRNKAVL